MNNLEDNNNEQTSEESQPWLMTYADMMTLLFAFFVLLYSMSSPDPVKMSAMEDAIAKEAGIEGRVIIAAFINKKGQAKNCYIVKGVFESLDQEALKAVQKSRWIPAKQQGKRIGVWVNIPVSFKLK